MAGTRRTGELAGSPVQVEAAAKRLQYQRNGSVGDGHRLVDPVVVHLVAELAEQFPTELRPALANGLMTTLIEAGAEHTGVTVAVLEGLRRAGVVR